MFWNGLLNVPTSFGNLISSKSHFLYLPLVFYINDGVQHMCFIAVIHFVKAAIPISAKTSRKIWEVVVSIVEDHFVSLDTFLSSFLSLWSVSSIIICRKVVGPAAVVLGVFDVSFIALKKPVIALIKTNSMKFGKSISRQEYFCENCELIRSRGHKCK